MFCRYELSFSILSFSHECVVSGLCKGSIYSLNLSDNNVCFLPNHIQLPDIFLSQSRHTISLMILLHFNMQTAGDLWNLLAWSQKLHFFFPPVVKSNIPSDSISAALQVLILYPACVHAFPCHPLLFSHLSLSVCQRARSDEISLSPWQQAARGLRPVLADAWSMIMSIDRKINVALILSLVFRE